ncbi:MAG: TDP-N-acetylfucosamine:lipid II N-acetylfucosaminyltransferase, partial [Intestinibacter sp.]|uniref:TDP-N-acetylfucosamine:lipid II N-acetylfucosaminyltransferase n=1 Tax=Intestinibacter sp. TaxID=1965304 RepID=UPI003F1760DD
ILHLVSDEKVINRCMDLFVKALPNQNLFLCFTSYSDLKYVKARPNLYFEISSLQNKIHNIDKVIIHYLDKTKIDFVNRYINEDISCYWIIWGADLYLTFLYPLGYSLYYEEGYVSWRSRINRILVSKIGLMPPGLKKNITFIKERINYVVGVTCDYKLLTKYIDGIQTPLISNFSYYSIDTILGELKNKWVNSQDIIVGNSCSITNNHVYTFKYLHNLALGNRKIIVPLNYGNYPRYKSHILSEGKRLFGTSFSPILEFLPLSQYNKTMLNVGIYIYGNWRQEAVGNIYISLYIGAKVFLSTKSPLYNELREQGLIIFGLEFISQDDLDKPLSMMDREHNRSIIYKLMSDDMIINVIRNTWG